MREARSIDAPRIAWRWLVLLSLFAAAAAPGAEAAVGATAVGATAAGATGAGPIDLASELGRIRADHPVPGLVAVVTDEERIVAQGAAGVRVAGGNDLIVVDDLMHIGSITKPFTATLVAELVDKQKLRWETTLAEAFPELASSMRPEYKAVTVAQLLAHEAGIQPFEDDQSPEFLGIPKLSEDARAQRRQFAAYALSLAPVAPPGTAFRYSNAGFAIAASIAESISGTAWEELVRARIFAPLGMDSAGVGWPNVRQAASPWGHLEKEGKLAPTPPDDPYVLPAWLAPVGDLSMSLPDLARFARLHLRGFDGRAEILAAETFRVMHTKRLRGGLGWGVSNLLGHEPVSTFAGSAGTFLAMIALVHDSDLAVIVAANSADEAANEAVKGALKALVVRFAGDRSPRPAAAPSN